MGIFTALFNSLRALATTDTGRIAILGAAVALTGSLMTFFRVFLERRSNKLVSRDARRRDYRHAFLKPLIDDVNALTNQYFKLEFELWMAAASDDAEKRKDYSQRAKRSLGSLLDSNRPVLSNSKFSEQFPIIHQTVYALNDLVQRTTTIMLPGDDPQAYDWLKRGSGHRQQLFLEFHRAVEHLLFGTSNFWAAWMLARRVRHRRLLRRLQKSQAKLQ